jgi:ADP-ribosylglycohydrolase
MEESNAQWLKESAAQIAREARDQWSGFDPDCIEAFKQGDRIGLPFEGGTMFQPINEQRLELALLSNQGSDESSIVDCFLRFAGGYQYTTREQFAWDWLDFHEQKHGTGYGRTYRNHFNLVAYIRKHTDKYPDLVSRIDKLEEIARDADSFGNGSLALVYPAYYYSAIIGEEPLEFVRYVTSFTHAHEDAMKAVTLLCSFIENPRLIAEYPIPDEDELKRLFCCSSYVTAYNTLLTALFIADAGTEMEVIRRGVETGGDTDSTLATAMLLLSLRSKGDTYER